jgi:hypothetical protein
VKWARTALQREKHTYAETKTRSNQELSFTIEQGMVIQPLQILPDYYAERTKRGDQNCRRKHVCHEICNLSNQHCEVSHLAQASQFFRIRRLSVT